MAEIDDRIVSMKFDNARFEEKLSQTIASLDKLRQSLDFANSTRGMNELSAAGRSFDMGNMASSIEGVSAKFLAFSTIAITALANITTRAIDSGARILKAFTFQPVIEGFREYETNINSIQTILANTDSKGTTLEQVNKALDQLNQYSDKTIYNFSQMTKNIGTFTAAGIDLDTSVGAIKGIANLAAVSGSNAEQASNAMYQLSQALASGSVKLMDWNSIVNAGMGGEVFQKSLFNTAKALGTIKDVPMKQSFDEWKKAGNTFRSSLEEGWITAEVLTTTLEGFTGDLTEAQIRAKGFTAEQAKEILRMGDVASRAATEVKTFTQLMGTIKESIGSGWSSSFRIILGNFEEAKSLFTEISNTIGSFVGESADARNALLQGWKDLGGRTLLIEAFKDALSGIGSILQPIKDAFRQIFPPQTAENLFNLTKAFASFTEKLIIGSETADKIKRSFAGVFAVFEIGWEIVKNIFGLIGDIVGEFSGVGNGILDFSANTGDALVALNNALVEGGKIKEFFDKIGAGIHVAAEFLRDFKDNIVEFFTTFQASKGVEQTVERIQGRFSSLSDISDRLRSSFERLSGVFDKFKNVLDKIWDYIKTWFSELGKKLAEALQPGDFDAAVDVVNVGLLGGIALMLKKFLSGGLKIDFGSGLIDKIKDTFDGLTDTLKAMQTQLKAKALLNIAIAVGVLTASVLVLSLIDSAALTKALIALSVSFGQLIGAMMLIDKISFSGSALKLSGIATAMVILAGAAVILSVAVKNLSSLGWEELAKGLIGVTAMLIALTKATQYIAADTGGLIRAGLAMTAMAIALGILSLAVKSFSDLSWSELAKGLTGVGIGLGIIVLAMNNMPTSGMVSAGLSIIAIATGLTILAEAVEKFTTFSWSEMGKGLAGVGAGLVIIAGAMHLMPGSMVGTASGILILSVALNIMAKALEAIGVLDLGVLVQGLGGLAGALGILALGINAMNGTAAGSASLLVASGALLILASVLKKLGKLNIAQIATGLAAIAGVLVILGTAAYFLTAVIPTLYGLGVALGLIGLSFALFGAGAFLVAKAFEALAKAGKAGVIIFIETLEALIKALPAFASALVVSLIHSVDEFVKAGDLLIRAAGVLLGHLLDTVIELTPKIGAAFVAIVTEGLRVIREKFPDFLRTGLELFLELLRGIRDNIGEIATLGIEIVTKLATTLTENANKIVESAVKLLVAFLGAIAAKAADIVKAGLGLLASFLQGIADNIFMVINAGGNIIIKFVEGIGKKAKDLVDAGANAIIKFIEGLGTNITRIIDAGIDFVIKLIEGITKGAVRFADACFMLITDFLNSLASVIRQRSKELRDAGINIISAIIDGMTFGLASKGKAVVDGTVGLAGKALGAAGRVLGISSPSKEFMKIGRFMALGMAEGLDKEDSAKNSAVDMAEKIVLAFQETLSKIPNSLDGLSDLNPVITPVLDLTKVQLASRDLNGLLSVSSITPRVSFEAARLISTTAEEQDTPTTPVESGPREFTFIQNNNSPKALSTNDIYRGTKSQIALAKEELNI